ncbi:MAG: hypothetical protein Crog4KO_13980 [Crocinitomicaceae bacterium]
MQAIRSHIQAFQITLTTIFQGRFLWFFLPGLIITFGYFALLYFFRLDQNGSMSSDDASWWDTLIQWFHTFAYWLYSFFTFLLEKIYVFLVITVLSPFHAFIAECFDQSMTGKKFPYSFAYFLQDFFRMLAVVSIALLMELGCIVVWWVLSFIPGLALLDDLMYFLISAFFYGFAFHDYALERYRLSIGKSIQFAFRHPLSMVCTGAIFLGIYAIPYAGIPFSGVITTMIATVVYLRIHNLIDENRIAINPKN